MIQGITPALPAAAVDTVIGFIESDSFRGSRHMPLSDAIIALTEDVVGSIPGLPKGPAIALKRALREVGSVLFPVGIDLN